MSKAVRTNVVTLVVSALIVAAALVAVGLNQSPASAVPTSDFSITSTISSSSTIQTPATLLPGAPRYLWYKVTNILNVPITVQSLSIESVVAPAGCATSNLNYSSTNFSGNLVVPASGTNTVSEPISLANLNTSQNNTGSSTENCANQSFALTFKGSAIYTATTNTLLTATPMSPAVAGQPVTLSATVSTVTPTNSPATPVGIATFYWCSVPSSSTSGCVPKTLIGTVNLLSGQASISTTPATTDTYYYEAIYTPSSSTDFLSSTSPVVERTVNYTNACGASGKINGSLTVAKGEFVFVNCRINGSVTVQSGGALFLQGATINGRTTSTGATVLQVCGSTISGGLSVSGTTGYILMGDGGDEGTPGCAANTVAGGVILTNNTGGFEIGGDKVSGGMIVTGNTVAATTSVESSPEIEGNSITGSLACSGNSNTLNAGGQSNTVTGIKSGQCSASVGF